MEIDELIEESKKYGVWSHLATVSPSGQPYVTPVHPAWLDGKLWVFISASSTKAKNIANEPRLSVHWQVSEETGFDSFIVWGTGVVHDDVETRRRMWDGVFDYDLNEFAPEGPEDSADAAFLEITPTKIVLLRQFGMGGREEWRG